MNDNKKLFDEMASYLSERGYSMVVAQVRAELLTGRLSEKRIQTLMEVETGFLDAGGFKKSQSAEFIRRDDYSDVDAVVLLLEAAKRAIIDGAAMVAQIQLSLRDFGLDDLTFQPEYYDEEKHVVRLNAPSVDPRIEKYAAEIDDLIAKVRVP